MHLLNVLIYLDLALNLKLQILDVALLEPRLGLELIDTLLEFLELPFHVIILATVQADDFRLERVELSLLLLL